MIYELCNSAQGWFGRFHRWHQHHFSLPESGVCPALCLVPRVISHSAIREREREGGKGGERKEAERGEMFGRRGTKRLKTHLFGTRNIWSRMFAHLNCCGILTLFTWFLTYRGFPYIHLKTDCDVRVCNITSVSLQNGCITVSPALWWLQTKEQSRTFHW